jgi:hypothetical protein
MLKKHFIRDSNDGIIGSVETGYGDASSIVLDERNQITRCILQRFLTMRDAHGSLTISADPRLVIGPTR